jgi:hypothetical protein
LWTGGSEIPEEYTDLILCRDVYHCLPSELDKEDWQTIANHIAMIEAESKVHKMKSQSKKKPAKKKGKRG